MADELRRKVSALWLFHGASIERALGLTVHRLAAAARDPEFSPEMQRAASEEETRANEALRAFRELGEELQK